MKQYSHHLILVLFIFLISSCKNPEPQIPTISLSPSATITPSLTVSPTLSPSPTPTITTTPIPLCSSISQITQGVTIELYGNFHTMGAILTINDFIIGQDARVMLDYRSGSDPFQQGYPLSRINENQFIGSLFWLDPDTTYEVKITLLDDNGELHCSEVITNGNTRPEPFSPEPVNSLLVSPAGTGSICSREQPCSLRTGLDKAVSGDAVILLGGIYYEGNINLSRSGTEENPIIIQGAAGEEAILDGSDPANFIWDDRGDGVFETTVNAVEPTLILADNQRLYRYQSYQDLVDLSQNLPGFFSQGYKVFVHLNDDADPNEHNMGVGRRKYGFWIEQDHIQIKNLTFRHFDVRWQRSGLYIRGGSNNLIQDCTFAHNGYGIILQGASNNNLIEHNEFYDSIYDWSWDAVKANHDRTGQGREAGGIYFNDPHPSRLQVMPRGTVIRRNTFHDFFDGFGISTFYTPTTPSNETDIYENYIYRIGDDGMEADGFSSNVRIFNNVFHDVLVGISLAPVQIGPTYVIGNLVYDIIRPSGCPFGKDGPCGGTGLKVQYGEPVSGPIYLYHNTFDGGSSNYSVFLSEPTDWPLLVSRNNSWGSPRSGGFGIKANDPVDMDYDNIFCKDEMVLIYWRGVNFRSFDDFKQVTNQESHGLSLDPRFYDIHAGDYRLRPDSPLIDAGIYIPGINQNYMGSGPDIGAFEFIP